MLIQSRARGANALPMELFNVCPYGTAALPQRCGELGMADIQPTGRPIRCQADVHIDLECAIR
jgi:hypothetical protein